MLVSRYCMYRDIPRNLSLGLWDSFYFIWFKYVVIVFGAHDFYVKQVVKRLIDVYRVDMD